jgi:hypothetical protein
VIGVSVPHPSHVFHAELSALDWSKGLTKRDVMQQLPNIDSSYFERVPENQTFHSEAEFWKYLEPMVTGPQASIPPSERS